MSQTKDIKKWKPYGGISRDLALEVHQFAMQLKTRHRGIGQRSISRQIKKRFNIFIREETIAGWIYRNIVPFANERTQFKPKPVPPRELLEEIYISKNESASVMAEKFSVSVIIVINWLRQYGIPTRTHRESMNTIAVKEELARQRLKTPIKDYRELTSSKAYILGVLCGDGYINQRLIRLEIRKDKEFADEFSKCLEEVYGLRYEPRYYARRNTYLVDLSSMIISSDLSRYGDFRTMTWSVPEGVYYSKNKEIKISFIRGMYDSEGSVGKYTISFTSASNAGITSLQQLLQQVGIRSILRRFRKKYYCLFISRKENIILFRNLVGFTIQRKMKKLFTMYKKDLREEIKKNA